MDRRTDGRMDRRKVFHMKDAQVGSKISPQACNSPLITGLLSRQISFYQGPSRRGGFFKFVHVLGFLGFLGIQHIFSTTIQIMLQKWSVVPCLSSALRFTSKPPSIYAV